MDKQMKKMTLVTLTGLLVFSRLFAGQKAARIGGTADFLRTGDSVLVTVRQYTGRLDEIATTYTAYASGNRLALSIPARDQPQYIELLFPNKGRTFLGPVILFPGDDMVIEVKSGSFLFKGSSAVRFSAQQKLREISIRFSQQMRLRFTPATLPRIFDHIDSGAAAQLNYLETKKKQLGLRAFRLLANDVKAGATCSKLGYLNYTCMNKPPEVQETFKTAFVQYGKPLNSFPSFSPADSSGKPASGCSAELVYQQYLADSCVFQQKRFSIHDCYAYESGHFKGEIREQLVTALFITKRSSPGITVADITQALDYVKNPDFIKVLEKIRATNTTGAAAPDFTLPDTANTPVNLKDYRGKLIVLDFWFTGCGACKAMAPRMQAIEKKYANRPVVFITICIDKKRAQWLATLKTNEYTSPLSLNLYTDGKGNEHRVIRDYDVRGYPTFVLIDKDGKLAPKPGLEEEEMSKLIDSYL
ncbi:TlpA family protein disulfide reductase [Mucilaginibacter angelicae]|uniref:TlpA family protein disulfide reductase n=1 Tax=Mucilaginibacter angelicae TaxID=869718 RepID=A0ABV6L5A5_9SPHI